MKLVPCVLLFLVPTVAAQSFNIDVGENLVGFFPEPLPSYGAAAGQPGEWNVCRTPYVTTLVQLDGSASSVTTSSTHSSQYASTVPGLSGGDRDLMDDVQDFGSAQSPATATWTFTGLQDGGYAVYTYAWFPSSASLAFRTGVTVVGSTDPAQSVGGTWSGSPHVLGTTYALHHVQVAGGTLIVLADSQNGIGAINGFQLVFDGMATTAVCSGDGTGGVCPCGNSGAIGRGCASSVSALGARLAGQGAASIAHDTLVLNGSDMPNSSALYFQGTAQAGAGVVFGDGLRCAVGMIRRLGTKVNASGASQYPGSADPSISVKGAVTLPGTRTYQVWYRNAALFCTPSTFNLSNGLQATWVP